MSEDNQELPYRAEYSKSGRANCKGCKNPIAKETLRLAVMVQSPFFDGKKPNWYHYMCFFGKQRPKSVNDIAHFESLRWEDQEKIRTKLESASADPVAPQAKEKGKKRASGAVGGLNDFSVEYAKSGRAVCRGCEQKILKDEVRISKKDYESEKSRMYGGVPLWHHVECFAKLRHTLGYCESGTVLPGFKTLTKDDQKVVESQLPKVAAVKKETTDEADGPTSAKQSKVDNKNDELRKKQSKTMFKYRDALKNALKNGLTKKELTLLLEHNEQDIPAGEERMLDRLSDIMTFGKLLPCENCKRGQFVFRSGVGYQCTGDLTDWTKCEEMVEEPKRSPFKVPAELSEKYEFLAKYKFTSNGKRLFEKAASSTSVKKEEESSGPKVSRALPPLTGMEFVLSSGVADKKTLKKKVEMLGGKVVPKVHEKLAAVIAGREEIEKKTAKVQHAKDMDIQVVTEDFLEKVKKTPAVDVIQNESICDWGSDVKSRLPDPTKSAPPKSLKSMSMYSKSGPSKVKLTVKGGSTVDPDSRLADVAHVYKKGKDMYNVVLGKTDVQSGKNSYYKLQILQSDHGDSFWCFRAWGRIGTTIGSHKLTEGSLHEVLHEFKTVYEEQTGNRWEERHNFTKVKGRMCPIDIDYGEDESDSMNLTDSKYKSLLAEPVQELVRLIFDINTMKQVMKEFELDLEKMPLGKLSKHQLQQAMSVLTDLQELIKSEGSRPQFIDASNRFYTLLPHDFGVETPPIINTEEMLKQKLEMVESLMEMEVAYSILKSGSNKGEDSSKEKHPLDIHYEKLKTEIVTVDKESEEFKLLQQYVINTHGETHRAYELEIEEAFKVRRQGEEKRYKPFRKLHNRKLLWHGSRLTNFAGILSQGLRIAPPEAPVTGYMFGKGIYFADMVSKSANYCCTSPFSPMGLMLLCEVALGNMYERTNADYIEKLPSGMHSTKGVGRTEPDPEKSHKREDGVEIPLGKGIDIKRRDVSLFYNEYIVYDVAQVQVQYLLKMNFKYKY